MGSIAHLKTYIKLKSTFWKYCKGIAAPGALQFELRQSVSNSERSIYHTQAGFEPTEAE